MSSDRFKNELTYVDIEKFSNLLKNDSSLMDSLLSDSPIHPAIVKFTDLVQENISFKWSGRIQELKDASIKNIETAGSYHEKITSWQEDFKRDQMIHEKMKETLVPLLEDLFKDEMYISSSINHITRVFDGLPEILTEKKEKCEKIITDAANGVITHLTNLHDVHEKKMVNQAEKKKYLATYDNTTKNASDMNKSMSQYNKIKNNNNMYAYVTYAANVGSIKETTNDRITRINNFINILTDDLNKEIKIFSAEKKLFIENNKNNSDLFLILEKNSAFTSQFKAIQDLEENLTNKKDEFLTEARVSAEEIKIKYDCIEKIIDLFR